MCKADIGDYDGNVITQDASETIITGKPTPLHVGHTLEKSNAKFEVEVP